MYDIYTYTFIFTDRYAEICRQIITSNLASDQIISIVTEAGLRLDGPSFDGNGRDTTQLSAIEILVKAGANLELEVDIYTLAMMLYFLLYR